MFHDNNIATCNMGTKVCVWNICWVLILLLPNACTANTHNSLEYNTTSTISVSPPPATTTDPKLVLCQCGPGEVMDYNRQCLPWINGTTVPLYGSGPNDIEYIDTKDLSVVINEIQCQDRMIYLPEDHFALIDLDYPSGGLLVLEGDLRGLAMHKTQYCIHHQQSGEQVKVTAQGCVPIPVIPRCCAEGEIMINRDCVSKSMMFVSFNPPLATGPFGEERLAGASFSWAKREEEIGKPICEDGELLKGVKLDNQKAYLFPMTTQSAMLTWQPEDNYRQYSVPDVYCVDAPQEDNTYYAYTCQRDLDVFCKDKTCIIKCCHEGKAFSTIEDVCVPSDLPFKPPFPSSLNFKTYFGFPTCDHISISNFELLEDATLSHKDNIYTLTEFCTDNFIGNKSSELRAWACLKEETNWESFKRKSLPYFFGVSCIFLTLLVLLHICISKLRDKEGKYTLFHAASLLVALFLSVILQVLEPSDEVCVSLAFLMQFAFLSTFFWLNIITFDVWRLFRNFVRNAYIPVRPVKTWIYILYGFGGPFTITMTTILIHFLAPKDSTLPWLIRPGIEEIRCWFGSEKAWWAYYRVPVAVLLILNIIFICFTYHYLKVVRGDYKSKDGPDGYTLSSTAIDRKNDYFDAFWQRFYLLTLLAGCWLTETLSVLIPPEELWAPTDILNSLQGVWVSIVFLTHQKKRAIVKEKLSKFLKVYKMCKNNVRRTNTVANISTSSSNIIDSNISSPSTGIETISMKYIGSQKRK